MGKIFLFFNVIILISCFPQVVALQHCCSYKPCLPELCAQEDETVSVVIFLLKVTFAVRKKREKHSPKMPLIVLLNYSLFSSKPN